MSCLFASYVVGCLGFILCCFVGFVVYVVYTFGLWGILWGRLLLGLGGFIV